MSELDMANVNDMASLHSTGLSERLGLEEEEAVSQLGWPSPVTEGMGLLTTNPLYIYVINRPWAGLLRVWGHLLGRT